MKSLHLKDRFVAYSLDLITAPSRVYCGVHGEAINDGETRIQSTYTAATLGTMILINPALLASAVFLPVGAIAGATLGTVAAASTFLRHSATFAADFDRHRFDALPRTHALHRKLETQGWILNAQSPGGPK